MSITPEDAAQDEWYSQLVDEISRDAIGDFQTERLQWYYLTYRDVAKNAIDRYLEAKELQPTHPGVALVLSVTAAEVGLKSVLLKPVIHGLVHNNAVAALVADLAVTHSGLDRFKAILRKILEMYGEIDFGEFRIEGHSKTLWEELSQVQTARNALVHRGGAHERSRLKTCLGSGDDGVGYLDTIRPARSWPAHNIRWHHPAGLTRRLAAVR